MVQSEIKECYEEMLRHYVFNIGGVSPYGGAAITPYLIKMVLGRYESLWPKSGMSNYFKKFIKGI